jgi:hypothetical protein
MKPNHKQQKPKAAGCPAWIIEGVHRKHQEAIHGKEKAPQVKPEARGGNLSNQQPF